MEIYRAWINQPSTLQPLHKYHGKRGMVEDDGGPSVRMYFSEGPVDSIMVPRLCFDRLTPKPKPTPAFQPGPDYRRKADRAWDLAGLARQDGDKAEEARWTAEARRLDELAR